MIRRRDELLEHLIDQARVSESGMRSIKGTEIHPSIR